MSDIIAKRERQWWIIFAVIVSSKHSRRAEKLTNMLLDNTPWINTDRIPLTPFGVIKMLIEEGRLGKKLRELRTGQYTRIERALTALVTRDLDLTTCIAQDLEEIHGIGPKTARFFLLKTRPGIRCAALDTHILKWLKARGHSVPKATPQSSKRYAEIEKIFLHECDKAGKEPAEMDAEIWESYAEPGGGNQT